MDHGQAQPRYALAQDHSVRDVARARDRRAAIRREVARDIDRWRNLYRFYHDKIAEYLRFIIPEGQSVLLLGCEDGALLSKVRPVEGVGVDSCPDMIRLARRRHPQHEYHLAEDYAVQGDRKFDYIVLHEVAGEVHDLFTLLQRLARCCRSDGRLVIVQHNYLWRPLLRLAALLGIKRPEATPNWLSTGDLQVFLHGAGFETIDIRPKLFCPLRWLGLGSLINWLAGLLPLVNRLASTDILVARPAPGDSQAAGKTASIILTVRDERENIEPMVQAIPKTGAETEIIFVEGHSTDGTREEVQRVIEAYPEKSIRLLAQDGVGQGDAIRKGFAHATGDVVILLEADQTSPSQDILKAFEVVATGRADYVNGSRFIYPRDKGSMPLRNVLGNWLFAVWFCWFLGQRTSDVLCGIKAIDRRQFHRLHHNWGFLGMFDPFGDFELIFGAARLGLKICEVPTRYLPRRYGQPKSRFFEHGWMLLGMAARATVVFKCR